MGGTPTEPKANRRWYQFRLWHLFVFVAICAIPCSWLACKMAKAKRQREAVAAIAKLGGRVMYDCQFDADDRYMPYAQQPGPAWFRNLVGVDFLTDVVRVSLLAEQVTDTDLRHLHGLDHLKWLILDSTQITDGGLEHLEGLAELERLALIDTKVSDNGLAHLKGLANLRYLCLGKTQITDAGLVHLKDMTYLKELSLDGTRVTDNGVEQLQKALPNCDIIHESAADGANHALQPDVLP